MSAKRAAFFIDGFNLYHSIASVRGFKKYKWLNLRSLCEKFTTTHEKTCDVYYFTAYATWKPESASRHRAYVAANRHFGCTPIFGKFIEKDRVSRVACNQPCNPENNKSKCGKTFTAHEEKLTDVNIAVHLLKTCVKGECDALYLMTGDNDLIPALLTAHELCPEINIRLILPFRARSRNLVTVCRENGFKYMSIKEVHLSESLLPAAVNDGKNTYTCPPEWAYHIAREEQSGNKNDPFYNAANMQRLDHSIQQMTERKYVSKTMDELEKIP